MRQFLAWLRRIARPSLRDSRPPPPEQIAERDGKLIDDMRYEILRRERTLQALEAKAKVRGGGR